jgi:hypothetical protein
MSFESAYKVEDVAAIRVAPEEIDGTFRSSSIGELPPFLCDGFKGALYSGASRRPEPPRCSYV